MTRRASTTRSAATALLFAASGAYAASNFDTGSPGSLSTSVNLNFSITVPRFVMLRVGSPASVDTLAFSPTLADLAASTPVLPVGGDAGASDVTVQVRSNAGNVTLTATTATADLVSGGLTVPWSTLSATNPTGTVVPPAFNSGSTLVTASSGIVDQAGTWRYAWTNPANTIYAAGTYSGTVTFTASTP